MVLSQAMTHKGYSDKPSQISPSWMFQLEAKEISSSQDWQKLFGLGSGLTDPLNDQTWNNGTSTR